MMKVLKTLFKIILALIIIVVVLFIAADKILLKERNPITAETFIGMMISKDFAVDETADDLEEYDILLRKSIKASHSGCEMVFYELETKEDAIKLFDIYKEEIKSITENVRSTLSSGVSNYQSYQKSTKETYYYIARIENTVLLVECDTDEKVDVRKLLTEMTYMIE